MTYCRDQEGQSITNFNKASCHLFVLLQPKGPLAHADLSTNRVRRALIIGHILKVIFELTNLKVIFEDWLTWRSILNWPNLESGPWSQPLYLSSHEYVQAQTTSNHVSILWGRRRISSDICSSLERLHRTQKIEISFLNVSSCTYSNKERYDSCDRRPRQSPQKMTVRPLPSIRTHSTRSLPRSRSLSGPLSPRRTRR